MRLQGVTDYNRDHLSRILESNLIDYFNWGCVQAGGFRNVAVASPGHPSAYGDETLKSVHAEGSADGCVWQGSRSAWCYEQGLDGVSPTTCQGVYVGGTFYPTASTTGKFAHYVDFTRGLVVFANPLLPSSVVQAAYAYRRANFVRVSSWFQPVVLDGYLTEQDGGVMAVLDRERLQTPLVAVEVVRVDGLEGYELGGQARWVRPTVVFYVLASTKDDRDRLSNIVVNQYNADLPLYDPNRRRQADDFELDARGMRRDGKSNYPQAVASYPYGEALFRDVDVAVQDTHTGLFLATCRARMEMVVGLV